MKSQGLEFLREAGVLITGTPDSVIAQIKKQYERLGGFDHFLMMMQAGFLDHKRTSESIKLFASEVLPQIRDLPPSMYLPNQQEAAQ